VLVGAAVLVAAVASSVFVAARPAVHRVPDLRGMPYAAAARTLHEQGLDEVTRTYVDEPGTERGTVLGQDPSPGAGAEDGEAVTLELASGRVRLRPAGLLGDGYVEAAREVVELGLVPRRSEVARAQGAGTVVDVGAAGRLTLGSLVTLTVAVAPEPAAVPADAPVDPVVVAPASSPRPSSEAPSAGRTTARAPQHHAPRVDGKQHGHQKAAKHGKSGKAHGKKK
jgi:beta-lactam-binding protein with PASTA domain